MSTLAGPSITPTRTRRSASRRTPWLFFLVYVVVVWLVVLPLGVLIYASFGLDPSATPFEQKQFGLGTYWTVITDPGTYSVLLTTLIFAVGSLVLGIGIALFLGWVVERTDIPVKRLVRFLIVVPMAIPIMVYAISWTNLASPREGWLNTILRAIVGSTADTGPLNIYTLPGMIIVEALAMAPFAYLMISATFTMVDPTLEQAARVSGASFGRTLRTITGPLMLPAILGAVVYFGIRVLETFEIPTTLGLTAGTPVVSTKIYFAAHPGGGSLPDYGLASVYSVMLLVLAIGFLVVYRRVIRSSEKYVTVTGKGWRPGIIPLGAWKWVITAIIWVYLLFSTVLPFGMMVWSSLFNFYRTPSFDAFGHVTLSAYQRVLQYPGLPQIAGSTVVVAVLSALLTCVLCLLVAWYVVRPPVRRKWASGLDFLSFLPLTIPGLVIGLALLFGYGRTALFGTVAILILGMVTKFLAFGSRSLIAAQMQISPELEEQALISGSGPLGVIRRVTIPLLAPALVNLAFWAAIVSIRELAMVLVLYTPKNAVVSTLVWTFWQTGEIGYASALGVLMFMLLGILYFGSMAISSRFRSRISA